MPLIKTQTSKKLSSKTKELLVKTLSAKCANVLDKSESYVASIIDDNTTISFGGELRDFAYVELKSIGSLNPIINKNLIIVICSIIEELIDIPSDKVYIEISDVQGAYWGWNNQTFG